ncbi:MAG: metalloregulator ArsR/SmtB family transcription factor [Deltaproteobacteria bacterium]|nr:metalloregulator ArsR/SmtB family transcription factor [Deltaproteobacteria bacterium]
MGGAVERNKADVCEIYYVNETHVRSARQALSPEKEVVLLAEAFRTLGDPTRVRILQALTVEELCVCDLAKLLGISESATSHQLRVLRSQKLVRYRKEGKMAFYSLDDAHIDSLMKEALRHVREGAEQAREGKDRISESAG